MKSYVNLSLAALMTLQISLQMNSAQAQSNVERLESTVSNALILALPIYAAVGVTAHLSQSTRPLMEQRAALLTKLKQIPDIQIFLDASQRLEVIDQELNRLSNPSLSRDEVVGRAQVLREERLEMRQLRTKYLHVALSQVNEDLLKMSNAARIALKTSTDAQVKELDRKIRLTERRLLSRVHMPIILGGVILVGIRFSEQNVSDVVQTALNSMSPDQQDNVMDNLAEELQNFEAGM